MSDELAGASEVVHNRAPAPPDPLLAAIVDRVPDVGWEVSRGQSVAIVPPHAVSDLAPWLRDEESFEMCVDVTAVDYLDHWDRTMGTFPGGPTRYEVVVNLLDLDAPRRLRLRIPVPEDEPRCPTLAYVWPSADAAEREVFDMFGIVFEGHPSLTRILMPDEWEGHPLRKDYAVGTIPVTFSGGSPGLRSAGRPTGPEA